MTTPNRPAVFIEKIFPVTLLNQQVYYEHGGNPFKGLHRWYSRKPLSFSRASVLGSLLPESVTMEEFEYLLGLDRPGANEKTPEKQERWTRTKLYKTPPSPERIKQVHDLCEQTWGTRTPTVLDAFAGGGSIPFEAVRYGLNVLASDLNPVAVVTMKAAMEYPLKFGPDLQHEIDKWVKWVGDEAEKRLAEFFPSQEGETTINYLWAHTVKCPSCESVIPLSPNWWLYRRNGKPNWRYWSAVKPIPNPLQKRIDFKFIGPGKGGGNTVKTEDGDYDPSEAMTINRGVGKCLNCESIVDNDIIYQQGKNGDMGHFLYAVAFRRFDDSLGFRIPEKEDLEATLKAKSYLDRKRNSWQSAGIYPDTPIPYGHQFAERSSLLQQGVDRWDKAFNYRQLLTLITYAEVIGEAKEKLMIEVETYKVSAVMSYLGLII